ncbi:BEL1-like homeodomain protein 1 [Lolium rigidum]|uniref:BEL1-like homeodomain protein 1 n=1 Tax=Lolium rigidum TaxID=89674 RepID=UPI001F5D2489|nr:BEL1-like homeodomain protein 1 [Lolium rigidum]
MPPPDHGGYGLGLSSGGATASDVGAQFAGNNLLLASLAGQLYASAYAQPPPPPPQGDHLGTRTPPEEEMDGGYGHSGAVTLACHGQSDARAMAPCSVSSSDSMASSTDQFSPGPSRSAVTHTSRAEPSQQQGYFQQPQQSFWPVHFAVVVARSPYAPVAQRALNNAVSHVLHGVADADADDPDVSGASSCSAVGLGDQSMASLEERSHGHGGARWGEAHRVRNELINLLQLMDEKYYRCLEEIQSTTAKFSGLVQPSGSSGGSICAPFAHRAVSSAYRALKRRITGEIIAAEGWPSHPHPHRAESSMMVSGVKMEESGSWDESAFIQKHLVPRRRALPHQDWRPHRGLPERSVSVLKAWLFENFLHPYPQDSEKDMLAARTGLTRNQVANWFINARVRLWKPLILELHEELKRSSGRVDGPAPPAMEHMSSQYVVG